MWCLTLVTNAIVSWSTDVPGLAVDELRADGRRVDDDVLTRHLPTHRENVGLFGTHSVDIDRELAQLDPTGHRPLRALADA